VTNEDLNGGNYTGVLGLACKSLAPVRCFPTALIRSTVPANSVILSTIPGTTSSNPDGATFLDNLFGSGATAPTQRLFSLALARREDIRTTSLLSIGAVSDSLCPSPCSPPYIPIIAQPSLGAVGYLQWRIPIGNVTATTWSDAKNGGGASGMDISLGASVADPLRKTPLAVLDSGGVAILVGSQAHADAMYGAYGISASSDGLCQSPTV